MAKTKETVISFLLDETGSMSSIKNDTIEGFNKYILNLKKELKGKAHFSLVKFDSSKRDKVCVGEELKNVPLLTDKNYIPGAMTPLIDASVDIIEATEKVVKKIGGKPNVIVTIQTDGAENYSTKHDANYLKELINKKEKEGWVFTFLGAGINSYDAARQYGIKENNTVSYGRDRSSEMFATLSANTVAYAQSGMAGSASFTDNQKMSVGDIYDKKATEKKNTGKNELDLTENWGN